MLSGLRCVYVFLRLIAFKLHFRGGMLGEMKYVLVGDRGLTEWIGAFTLFILFSKTGFREEQGIVRCLMVTVEGETHADKVRRGGQASQPMTHQPRKLYS